MRTAGTLCCVVIVLGIFSLRAPQSDALAGGYPTELNSGYSWVPAGPMQMNNQLANFGGYVKGSPLANATGRITALAVDPRTSGQTIFVGAAGGGVWVSTNGGTSFAPFADTLPVDSGGQPIYGPTQAIGAIAIDPVNPPSGSPTTVYVATGEGNYSGDSYYGIGIFMSTDLGKTIKWLLYPGMAISPNTYFGYPAFTKLAIDTSHNPPYLYAAGVSFGNSANRADATWRESGSRDHGLYISYNGGQTWLQTLTAVSGPHCLPGALCVPAYIDDVAVDPLNPSRVYAAVDGVGVYYSTNSGGTWTAVCSKSNPQCGQLVGRISLATEPPGSSSAVLYAMYGYSDYKTYTGFYSSTNGGVSWTARTVPSWIVSGTSPGCTLIDGAYNQTICNKALQYSLSVYDQVLAVSPANPATVYFGGVAPYLSTDSGSSWTPLATTGGTHTDQHAAQFDSFNNTLLVGNDGGLYIYNLSTGKWPPGLNSTISAGQI